MTWYPHANVMNATTLDGCSRGTHPLKSAKCGAASVGVLQQLGYCNKKRKAGPTPPSRLCARYEWAATKHKRKRTIVVLLVLGPLVVVLLIFTIVGWWQTRIAPHRHASLLLSEHHEELASMIATFRGTGVNVLTGGQGELLIDGKSVSCGVNGCQVSE